jgi:hypothetical protein
MKQAFDINTTNQQNKSEVAISFLKELADLLEKHKVINMGTIKKRGSWGSETDYINVSFTDWAVPDIDFCTNICSEEIKSQLKFLEAPGNQGA